MPKYTILVNVQYAHLYEVQADSEEQARELFEDDEENAVLIRDEFLEQTICDIELIKE